MKLNFRQGLVRYQTDLSLTPTFLQKHSLPGEWIDLMVNPDPTIVTFAHGPTDYLIEETSTVTYAWGPFIHPTGETQHLYWDINLMNGSLTRGYTLLPPIYSNSEPNSPANDQHWFDQNTNQMKVRQNNRWVIKIRCFAAVYDTNATIIPFTKGSQAGLNNINVSSGSILYGKDNKPLRHQDGTLVTSEDNLTVGRGASQHVRFDSALIFASAMEAIPEFHLVSFVSDDKIGLASYINTDRQIAGVVLEDLHENEIGKVITNGQIRNIQWNFADTSIGNPVFCGLHGEITETAPPTGISQQVGIIQGKQTINVNIMVPVILSV